MKTLTLVPVLLATLLASTAFAQTAVSTTAATPAQRDVTQQTRIENGLQSGALTVHEASKLEAETAKVNRVEAKASQDGTVTAAEKTRIDNLQNKVSTDIHAQKHDAQTGNPNSVASLRTQADVQRNVNQETRIANGVANGSLTPKETAKLKRGQARVQRKEARAAANGKVSAGEQAKVQVAENRQSRRIFREKHD
jgi:hypothetical protein